MLSINPPNAASRSFGPLGGQPPGRYGSSMSLPNDQASLHSKAYRSAIYADPDYDFDGADHQKRVEYALHAQATALVEIAEHLAHIRHTQDLTAEHIKYIKGAIEGINNAQQGSS